MGNFQYILYKNRVKIVAVSILVVCTIVGIVVAVTSNKKGNPDDITDSGGNITSNEGTAIITVPPDEDDGIREIVEKQVVVRVTESDKKVYEVVLDKINGGTYLFVDGTMTDTRCLMENIRLDEPLITLNKGIDGVPLSSLAVPRIEGAYEINSNTASGVINHLITLGAKEIRRIETQDYFEIYLKEKDGAVKRIIVTKNLMLMADYGREEFPIVSSYWHEY